MAAPTPLTTCYRHADRRAGVTCQRCGRPICPSCMVQAPVGFHCPECVKGAARSSPTIRARELRPDQPVVTLALVALSVIGLLAEVATGGSLMSGGGTATENGMLIGFGQVLERLPFGYRAVDVGVAAGEWWRIVTSGFLHAGLLHLGMNMLLLYLVGRLLEPLLGRLRFAALYLACLVAGSFGVLLVSPTAGTVGASGAIFGVMGAMVIAQRRAGIDVWRSGIGGLIVINLLLTFTVPGISAGAHVGGLVAGILVGAVVFALDRAVRSPLLGAAFCLAITAVLWVGCLWAASRWANPVL